MDARGDHGTRGEVATQSWAPLLWFAAAKLSFHVLTNDSYGFHRDELATLADARHLDWGFVAYPPLTPALGRLALILFGTSLTGFRFFAALAQSVAVLLTGAMARRFGASPRAQLAAAAAVAIAPISLSASSLFQYVSFDDLWFVLMAYLVVRLVDSKDARWWVGIGAVIGMGWLTKYSVLVFAAGLGVGTLVTPLRAHLRTRWPWLGAAVALAIACPNLVWQVQHDFISLDFLRHIHARDVRIGRTAEFLPDQLLVATNVFTAPLWLWGLYVVLGSSRGRPYRVLGWMAVTPFVIFLAAHGRGYYLGPIYPMLFAAGAADLERIMRAWPAWGRSWAVAAGSVLLLVGGGLASVAVLPLAPPGSGLFRWAAAQNGDLAEEIGWPELVREVARIYETLPPEEKLRTGIFCGNYGEAGAVDLYGPAHGLPGAISGKNSYWLRGPGRPAPQTLIVLGEDRDMLDHLCASVELAGHTSNPWNVKNEESERHPDIYLCRGLRQPLDAVWPSLRSFG